MSPVAVVRAQLRTLIVSAAVLLAATVYAGSAQAAQTGHQRALGTQYAAAMLVMLNAERRDHRLPALTMNPRLVASAHRHDWVMGTHDELTHQYRGEPFFAARITLAGYRWSNSGENIGETTDRTRHGVENLERTMYDEKAPRNGHRLNILSPKFTQVGMDVMFDNAHDKIWLTQDYARPA